MRGEQRSGTSSPASIPTRMSDRDLQDTDDGYDLLLIEVEPDGVAPFIESFENTDATNTVHVVTDGDEALDFLARRGAAVQAPQPDLIILDLHVSGTDGKQILTELTAEPELRRVPIIVFTTSARAEDVARSYELNANAYLQKPNSADALRSLAQLIEDFWLNRAQLPPKAD